jgi:hypothetical protein
MGFWRTRCGPVVKTGYVVVLVMMMMIIIIMTTMILNFTLVFTLYCQDETKCSIEAGFKILFEGFFIVVYETWKSRGEIRYNFDYM